jgi:hypothetical protein
MCTKVWLEYLEGIDHFKELGKNGWIFQWILGKSGMHVQACAHALTCVCGVLSLVLFIAVLPSHILCRDTLVCVMPGKDVACHTFFFNVYLDNAINEWQRILYNYFIISCKN